MNKRKNIFFTSDWHIGHENVLVYSNRPFKDINHMHRVLVNNYNACVRDDDICYFLGDVGLSKKEITKRVISELNGTKILIQGNHDPGINACYDLGFDVVINSASIKVGSNLVTMNHFPLFGVYREDTSTMTKSEGMNWHGELKHKLWTLEDRGQFHLHGHIHSPNGGKSQTILGHQMDVGVDGNKYCPVSMSTIESWIARTK